MIKIVFEDDPDHRGRSRIMVTIKNDDEVKSVAIRDYKHFLEMMAVAKHSLANKEDKACRIKIRHTLFQVPWFTDGNAKRVGRIIRDLPDINIELQSRAWWSLRSMISFSPFLEQIGTAATIKCGYGELSFLDGCNIDTLDITDFAECSDPGEGPLGWDIYLQPLFCINAQSYICEHSLYVHQLYLSRFPSQPSVKLLNCALDIKEYPEDLYENIFQELLVTLPNLQVLELKGHICCNSPNLILPYLKLLVLHLNQIQTASHVSVKINFQFGTKDEEINKLSVSEASQILQGLEGTTERAESNNTQIKYTSGNLTLMMTMTLEHYYSHIGFTF